MTSSPVNGTGGGPTSRAQRFTIYLAISAVLAMILTGCATNHGANHGAADEVVGSAPDSLRGTIRVVGADPNTQVMLQPAADAAATLLQGDPIPELRSLSGVEVQVEGWAGQGGDEDDRGGAGRERATPPGGFGARTFVVNRFNVRAVGGLPALDGTLVEEGGSWYLRRHDGELHRIMELPTAMAGSVGARVWVTGKIEGGEVRGITSYGVIQAFP